MHERHSGAVAEVGAEAGAHRWWGGLRSLLAARGGREGQRPLGRCLVGMVLCTVLAVGLNHRLFAERHSPLVSDQHALLSLSLAVNRAEFGAVSHNYVAAGPSAVDFCSLIAGDAALLEQEVRSLPGRLTASREEYRQRLTPFLNNENSLMLLDLALLRLLPHCTLNDFIRGHTVLKLICVAIFVFMLFRVGASPLLALAAAYLGALIIERTGERFPISLYPYLMPLTVLLLALFTAALSYGAHRRGWSAMAVLGGLGFVSAFVVQLRTSYSPVVLAFLLLYAGTAAVNLWRDRTLPRWRWAVLTLVPLLAFGAGFRLFMARFIAPLHTATAGTTGQTYAYHVIGHPLVVTLGLPPACALTEREGIQPDDAVGLVIARRIDPAVQYLGPNYDSALLTYYCKLWLYYPQEMLERYWMRLRTAGASVWPVFLNDPQKLGGRQGRVARTIAAPLRWLPDGSAYLLGFAALIAVGIGSFYFLNVGAAFLVTAIGVAGTLLQLESAIFTPWFVLGYHNTLLLLLLAVGLLAYQVGANAVVAVPSFFLARRRSRLVGTRPHQPSDTPAAVA